MSLCVHASTGSELQTSGPNPVLFPVMLVVARAGAEAIASTSNAVNSTRKRLLSIKRNFGGKGLSEFSFFNGVKKGFLSIA